MQPSLKIQDLESFTLPFSHRTGVCMGCCAGYLHAAVVKSRQIHKETNQQNFEFGL